MPEMTDIKGVSDNRADDLRDAGYTSVDDIATADEDGLTEVSGIGASTAPDLIESAQSVLQEEHGVEADDTDDSDEEEDGGEDVTIEDLEEINEDEPDGYNEPRDEDEVTAEDDDPEPREVDTSPDLYDVTLTIESDHGYDYLLTALVELKGQRISATNKQARMADGLLDEFRPLGGAGEVTVELDADELNTLHSAVTQVVTRYQGSNQVEAFNALKRVENQIQDAREEHLF